MKFAVKEEVWLQLFKAVNAISTKYSYPMNSPIFFLIFNHWILIYTADRVFRLLDNWGLVVAFFVTGRSEAQSEFPGRGMFFLCMNGSSQQHYKSYVITSLCFSYKNNKKRITIEHFSHFITMNKTSKFLVLLKPVIMSSLCTQCANRYIERR